MIHWRNTTKKQRQSTFRKLPKGTIRKQIDKINDNSTYLRKCAKIAGKITFNELLEKGYGASCYVTPIGVFQGRKYSIKIELTIFCLRYKTVGELETFPFIVDEDTRYEIYHSGIDSVRCKPDDYCRTHTNYDECKFVPIRHKIVHSFDFYKHDFEARLHLAIEEFLFLMHNTNRYPIKKR